MPQPDLFVGIDVAKDELVVHFHPDATGLTTANTPRGLTALGRKLQRLAARRTVRIGFEASGGYERKLGAMLDRLSLTAYMLDPLRVRSFARAERQIAKTDPLDAALIARCLAALHETLTPWRHDPMALKITEHVRMRDLAVSQTGQLASQLDTLGDAAMRRIVKAQIARLKAVIVRIEQAIARLVAASPALAHREALLRSAPGVGPIVAATLLAYLPELGSLSSRQAAALAGLAPFDRQSATTRKPARCSGGRPAVRRALYLAALSIMRARNQPLANLGQRLQNNGKPIKVAIIATARKLLVALNAMLKNNQAYTPM